MATTTATSSTGSSGSSILTNLGVGSGIDTAGLVTNLTAATFDPQKQALTTKESANTAKISELATLSSGIDSFSSALQSLIAGGTLRTQPASSNASVLTASAKAGAQLGNLSTQLTVKQVAQAQSLVSDYSASATAAIGNGGLEITVGGTTKTVTIDAAGNSLTGIAKAINAAGAGVTATVLTDANGARLAIKGATGAASAFTIAASAGSDAALAAFAYPGAMTRAQEAKDAIVTRDGIDVARATNTIDDMIEGVSLTLVKASDEPITLGAARPTAAITQAVTDFVDAYNALRSELTTATSATGAFPNASSVRQMTAQLSKLTSTVLNTSGGPQTLAEIGVKTNRDGTLAVDGTQLAKMLASYPDGVEAMFNGSQRASDPLIKVTSAIGATKPGTYTLANIRADGGSGYPTGQIGGVAGLPNGQLLAASISSPAYGLIIRPEGDVASATVSIDPGLGGALKAIRDTLRKSGGLLDSIGTTLNTEKKGLADKRLKVEADEAAYKTRLTTQFTAMDSRVAAFKATQSYLDQQVKIWTKSDS